MKRGMVVLLCAALALPGCASTRATGAVVTPAAGVQLADRAVLAEYVQRLPLGSLVRVNLTDGKELRGTLMKATDLSVVIQPRTRVPEPPLDISLKEVIGVTLDDTKGRGSVAKAIGVGAATGLAATLGLILILIAAAD
jgi:hypothetical protein